MKLNDASRILQAIDRRVESKLGVQLETTWGTVSAVSADHKTCSVLLYGEEVTASEDFRVPADIAVSVGDAVKVAMDSRGERWVYDVVAATAYKKIEVNPTLGQILLGDGSAAPGATTLDSTAITTPHLNVGSAYLDTATPLLYMPNGAKITFGEVNILRPSAGLLESDGTLQAKRPAGSSAFRAKESGAADWSWRVISDGKQEWAPANGTADTNLYRSAADALKTDDLLNAVLGVQVNGSPLARYVPLSALYDVAADATETATTDQTHTSTEITALPTTGVVAVTGLILARQVGADGGYLYVAHYDYPTVYSGIVYGLVAYGTLFGACHFLVTTGGTNSRQIKYTSKSITSGTLHYYVRITGYWTTK